MDSDKLLKLSFLWAILGVALLIVIANFAQPKLVSISCLDKLEGKTVIIDGTVKDATYKNTVSIFSVEDSTGTISVILFDLPTKYVDKGNHVQVQGKVEEYRGKIEVIADQIVCLDCD